MNKYIIKQFAAACVALAALTACSSDNNTQQQVSEERLPILLSASPQGAETRAGQGIQNTQFEEGQEIDVQITSQDNMTGYDMLTYYTSDDQGNMVPKKGVFPYYPVNKAKVDIRAIYPKGKMNASSFTIEYPQVTKSAYQASDLMFAQVTDISPSSNAVPLTFTHKMSKVMVNLTGEGGVNLTNSVVTLLGVKRVVAFNALTGVVGAASGATCNIQMTSDGGVPSACIIVPQSVPRGYLMEILLQNNDVLYYRTVQDMVFESGKKYTFNVKVIESNISVKTSVSDWNTEPEDVEQPLQL